MLERGCNLLTISCPHCGKSLKGKDDLAGRIVICPACKTEFEIPLPAIPVNQPERESEPLDFLNSTQKTPFYLLPPKAEPEQPHQQVQLDHGHSNIFGLEDGGDFGIGAAAKATVEEFRSLDYRYLLPFGKIFSRSLLRKRAVRWVIGFGLFPLILLYVKEKFDWSLTSASWWLGGYFCLFWAAYFGGVLRPQTKVWQRGAKWAIFTLFIGVPILLIAQRLPVINTFYSGAESESFLFRLAGFVLGVGFMEETCKAIPFLLFALRKKEVILMKNGIFLGMMSGFGFALAEIVQYSVAYWSLSASASALATARAIDNPSNYSGLLPQLVEFSGSMLLVQIVRFITSPLLHACWAGSVGWFIAAASHRKGTRWPVVLMGILFVATLHGLFDLFSGGLIGVAFAALSLVVFMGYLIHAIDEETASNNVRCNMSDQVDSKSAPSPNPPPGAPPTPEQPSQPKTPGQVLDAALAVVMRFGNACARGWSALDRIARFFVVCVGVILICCVLFAMKDFTVGENTRRGVEALQKQNWDLAIDEFAAVIQRDPRNATAYTYRGLAQLGLARYGKGNWDLAIADFSEAIQLDPTDSQHYANRGLAQMGKREWDLAITDFSEAIRLYPTDARAYVLRARAHAPKGEWKEVIADCTEAIRLDPTCADAYAVRSVAHNKTGDRDEARADHDRADKLGFVVSDLAE